MAFITVEAHHTALAAAINRRMDTTDACDPASAYIEGWTACFAGEDGRFTNPHRANKEAAYAWTHGFLDAMEAEDGENPEPACAGY